MHDFKKIAACLELFCTIVQLLNFFMVWSLTDTRFFMAITKQVYPMSQSHSRRMYLTGCISTLPPNSMKQKQATRQPRQKMLMRVVPVMKMRQSTSQKKQLKTNTFTISRQHLRTKQRPHLQFTKKANHTAKYYKAKPSL